MKTKTETTYPRDGEIGISEEEFWNDVFGYLIKRDTKQAVNMASEAILNFHQFKTLSDNEQLWYYENGVYVPTAETKVKQIIQEKEKIADFITSHFVSEVIASVKRKTYAPREEINNTLVNFENGLYNPQTKEFSKHNPEIFSIVRLPFKYDPKAECPLWKEKLAEKIDEPTINVLQEMFGYVYVKGQPFQRAFLLHGVRRTMKSTILRVLCELIGKENTKAYSLQYLTKNEFAIAYLYGVPLNVCADLSSDGLRNTGEFMKITGGDKISSARKHEHPIHFYPDTKLVFSCNTIPPTTNKDLAFYRRWIILEFKRQTAIKDIDPELTEKLLEELSGIFNWAMEGYDRLLENQEFSYWLNEEEVKDIYEKSSNSIQSFIFNKIDTEDDECVLKKREVYKAYEDYCKEENLQIENHIRFGRWFKALTGCGECRQDKIPAYQGVSWFVKKTKQEKIGDIYDSE